MVMPGNTVLRRLKQTWQEFEDCLNYMLPVQPRLTKQDHVQKKKRGGGAKRGGQEREGPCLRTVPKQYIEHH